MCVGSSLNNHILVRFVAKGLTNLAYMASAVGRARDTEHAIQSSTNSSTDLWQPSRFPPLWSLGASTDLMAIDQMASRTFLSHKVDLWGNK